MDLKSSSTPNKCALKKQESYRNVLRTRPQMAIGRMECEMKQLWVLLLVVCMGACGTVEDVAPTEGSNTSIKQADDHGAHGHDHGEHGHDHADKAHAETNKAHAETDKACDHGKEGSACEEAKEEGACSCPAIKDGTGWCDHCSSGYVDGEKTQDKAKVDAAVTNN